MRLFGYEIKKAEQAEERNCAPASDASPLLWGALTQAFLLGEATPQRALAVPAFWAAIKVISETLASLPTHVYRITDEGSSLDAKHPVQRLLMREANEMQTAYDFRRTLYANACFGNAYAKIYKNGIGRPVRLEILQSEYVKPVQGTNGRYYYEYSQQSGKKELYTPAEVIHIKGMSLDGMVGMNVGRIHKDTINASYEAQRFAGEFYGNGAHVSGALVYPQSLTKDQREAAEKKIARVSGTQSAGKTMVLDAGVKYERFGLDMEESGLVEYRNMGVDDMARIFGVPAHLLAQLDRATFNNIEVMSTQFVTLCLRPWAVQVEQEFSRKLLSGEERENGTHFIRINLDGLLRGDTESRAAYYNTMFNIGAMSPNDIREHENMNKREGGDEYYTPLNMSNKEAEMQNETQDDDNEPEPDTAD
jgi:HK97 family phage portal protein